MKVTAIKQQVKRQDRYSVFVDGAYAFSLSESGLIASGLASGQELSTADLAKQKESAGLDKAYGNALRYAVMRPRSEWELAQYFRRKQIDESAAAYITDRLRRIDLLDDTAFARAWVANRRQLRSVSRRRLQQELQQKHVAEVIVRQVLDEDPADERDQLRQLIAKKRQRYPDRQKFMQYLARQGFGYDDIKTTLAETAADFDEAL